MSSKSAIWWLLLATAMWAMNEVFLASLEVRYRLLFNALTSPHFFGGTDIQAYEKFRYEAESSSTDLQLA